MTAQSFDHERLDGYRLSIDYVARSFCDAAIDYDNEHRCAEHEHESQTEETPEPWDATERRW
jgi:hypothetical protein